MDRKIIATLAVLVLSIAVVPVTSGEADASTTTVNMCDKYLCMTTIDWDSKYKIDREYLYFNVDSDNDLKMQQYVEDQKNPVLKDDRDNLKGAVHVYVQSYYSSTSIVIFDDKWERVDILMCSSVLDPFNNSFFVKAGDTFSLQMYSVKDMYGYDARAEIMDSNYEYHDLSKGKYTEKSNKSKEISIKLEPDYWDNALRPYCYTMTYEASGYSEPNGSATVFIAISAIVTVLALGLLILSGKKPGWSK